MRCAPVPFRSSQIEEKPQRPVQAVREYLWVGLPMEAILLLCACRSQVIIRSVSGSICFRIPLAESRLIAHLTLRIALVLKRAVRVIHGRFQIVFNASQWDTAAFMLRLNNNTCRSRLPFNALEIMLQVGKHKERRAPHKPPRRNQADHVPIAPQQEPAMSEHINRYPEAKSIDQRPHICGPRTARYNQAQQGETVEDDDMTQKYGLENAPGEQFIKLLSVFMHEIRVRTIVGIGHAERE